MPSERYEQGLKVRREVLGDAHVDRSLAQAEGDPLTEELQQMVTEIGWGEIWTRPGLERKTRSMLNLAMLTALNRPHEFEVHVRGAINNGVSKTEVKEILLHVSAYCGWPAAIDGFRIAKRVYAEVEGTA